MSFMSDLQSWFTIFLLILVHSFSSIFFNSLALQVLKFKLYCPNKIFTLQQVLLWSSKLQFALKAIFQTSVFVSKAIRWNNLWKFAWDSQLLVPLLSSACSSAYFTMLLQVYTSSKREKFWILRPALGWQEWQVVVPDLVKSNYTKWGS